MGIFSFGKKRTDTSEREGRPRDGGRSARTSERRERTMSAAGSGSNSAPAAARVRRSAGGQETMLDPTLPEKQRARRRLVGAIALVLAAVVILPMVLDSHPKPVTSDIAISIPDQDGVRASTRRGSEAVVRGTTGNGAGSNASTLALSGDDDTSSHDAMEARSGTTNATDAAAPDTPPLNANARSNADATGGADASKAVARSAATGSKSAGVVATMPNALGKPSTTPPAKAETNYPKPQPGPTDGAADASLPATPATPGSRYVVQLGVFNSDASAREWVTKLKNIGVPAYTAQVKQANGTTQVMLRAGPFADRTVAQAAVMKVRRAGLSEAGH